MKNLTYKEIKKIYDKHNYRFFDTGNFNLNIFGVRSIAQKQNSFDDILGVAYKNQGKEILETWPITTEPGKFWLENPGNVNGTAVLAEGQYLGAFKIRKHRGIYDAVCQAKPVKVFRDNDRDQKYDLDPLKTEEGVFGINIHKAGENSKQVDKWSAGCQVFAAKKDFDEFMQLAYKAKGIYGNSFSYTLFNEKNI